MNYGHLERFRVTLIVRSPLYIGSGGKLSAKELIVDARRNAVLVPSLPELTAFIAGHRKARMATDFVNFLMDSRQKDLGGFLRRFFVEPDPSAEWVRYAVSLQPGIQNINTLHTFVRDVDGRAYIPGSSIKGALRTALIAARMSEGDKRSLCDELAENPRSRRASAVENALRVLRCNELRPKDAVNDLMRAVEVSDAAPFPAEALTVCQRVWLTTDERESWGRSPIYMECLRPDAQTHFYLTIDRSLWPDADALRTLFAALSDWDALLRRVYDACFRHALAGLGPMNGAPITLGGGTGFQRKSLVYRAKADPADAVRVATRTLQAQFTTYKHPSPQCAPYLYKAARYQYQNYPIGACELRV